MNACTLKTLCALTYKFISYKRYHKINKLLFIGLYYFLFYHFYFLIIINKYETTFNNFSCINYNMTFNLSNA